MSKYRKLTYCIYHCTYQIVWTPKYRLRVLEGKIRDIIEQKIRQLCEWYFVKIEKIKIESDHIHMV